MNKVQNSLVPFVPFVPCTSGTNSTNYRYILDRSSKKFVCPSCGKKTFVRFIDDETGLMLPSQYGRCDRESKCAYFLDPYSDGYAKDDSEPTNLSGWKPKPKQAAPEAAPVYFDFETFIQTLKGYENNTFIQNLISRVPFPFEVDEVTKVIQLYRLGTIASGYRAGAVTFPFIDIAGNVRAIQVKQFDETNHTAGTDFLHSIIEKHCTRNSQPLPDWLKAYTAQEKRVSCLFGEHLLSSRTTTPVALVEAPKTAVYGTLYFPQFVWLAVYNKSSFSIDKLKALKGRDVFVFPDLSKDGSTFKEWKAKADHYEKQLPGTRFIFSDLLERLAPEQDRESGNDIADILIKIDWRLFTEREKCEKREALTKHLFFQPEAKPVFSIAICEGCPPDAFCVPGICPRTKELAPK